MENAGPILIVDDEEDLLNLLDINLRREGFRTVTAKTAADALRLARTEAPALVVLDLMLPDFSGTEVCRRLRADEATAFVPIIMLTAKADEIDRVVGFEVGADDYIVKTAFSVRELVLRVRAVLRRAGGKSAVTSPPPAAEDPVRQVYGVLAMDREAHRVWVNEEEVVLTATEFKLLGALVDRGGRVLTRGSLLQDVWDMPPDLNTRTVDTHVKRLREKLGDGAAYVETVRGVGYRFHFEAR